MRPRKGKGQREEGKGKREGRREKVKDEGAPCAVTETARATLTRDGLIALFPLTFSLCPWPLSVPRHRVLTRRTPPRRRHRAAAFADVRFVFVAELFNR